MDNKKLWHAIPKKPGVYLFKDTSRSILYVGKAINLKKRVSSYFAKIPLGDRTKTMVSQISSIEHIVVENELEALLLETNLIKRYMPRYNVRWTDGKAYPFIKITIQEDYPKVLEARRLDNSKSKFFGPYPTVNVMRNVLKTVRRIFPFQSVRAHQNRPCLYYHLGLCPCPAVFGEDVKKEYRRNIGYLISFLEGKKQAVLKNLLFDMKKAAKDEAFEKAAKIKRQIEQIQIITSPLHQPNEYLENPNLRIDTRKQELNELKNVLLKQNIYIDNLTRIECFDISNIQGRNATGSMAVFVNGEKEATLYRHFKIKLLQTPNDFLMMQEVILRRLKHDDWEYPGLFIVDGGKAQVSATRAVLLRQKVTIPVIGLAKRLEEIVLPKDGEFVLVRLPLSSPAINLLRRIRDEAHRFALRYHRKLRLKTLIS